MEKTNVQRCYTTTILTCKVTGIPLVTSDRDLLSEASISTIDFRSF